MEYFVENRGMPTGIPGPARGGEKKWVPPDGHGQAWLRPASAGKKRITRKWDSVFSPLRDIFCFPGENKMDSYNIPGDQLACSYEPKNHTFLFEIAFYH